MTQAEGQSASNGLDEIHTALRVIRGRLSVLESVRPASAALKSDVEELSVGMRQLHQTQVNLKTALEISENALAERITAAPAQFLKSLEAIEQGLRDETTKVAEEVEQRTQDHRLNLKAVYEDLDQKVDSLAATVQELIQEQQQSSADVRRMLETSLNDLDARFAAVVNAITTEVKTKHEETKAALTYSHETLALKIACQEDANRSLSTSVRTAEDAVRKSIAPASGVDVHYAENQHALTAVGQLEAKVEQELETMGHQQSQLHEKASRALTAAVSASETTIRGELEKTAGHISVLLERIGSSMADVDAKLMLEVEQARVLAEAHHEQDRRLSQLEAAQEGLADRLSRSEKACREVSEAAEKANSYTDGRIEEHKEAVRCSLAELERNWAEVAQSQSNCDAKQKAYHSAVDQSLRSIDERLAERVASLTGEQGQLFKEQGDRFLRSVEDLETRLRDSVAQASRDYASLLSEVSQFGTKTDTLQSEQRGMQIMFEEKTKEFTDAASKLSKDVEVKHQRHVGHMNDFLEQLSVDLRKEIAVLAARSEARHDENRTEVRAQLSETAQQLSNETMRLFNENSSAISEERRRAEDTVDCLEQRISDVWQSLLRMNKEHQDNQQRYCDSLLLSQREVVEAMKTIKPEVSLSIGPPPLANAMPGMTPSFRPVVVPAGAHVANHAGPATPAPGPLRPIGQNAVAPGNGSTSAAQRSPISRSAGALAYAPGALHSEEPKAQQIPQVHAIHPPEETKHQAQAEKLAHEHSSTPRARGVWVSATTDESQAAIVEEAWAAAALQTPRVPPANSIEAFLEGGRARRRQATSQRSLSPRDPRARGLRDTRAHRVSLPPKNVQDLEASSSSVSTVKHKHRSVSPPATAQSLSRSGFGVGNPRVA